MVEEGRGISKEGAKAELKKLIEFFNRNKDIYERSSEQNIRQKLIDELFIILGWDLRGKESADEVTMEESISNEASKKKKSDYVFRLYGVPKFVVEAKAVKIDINSEVFREQAVGYTYNLACSWAVLTNFIQTRVYFVDKNDDTSIISIDNLSDLSKFDDNFERLWLLSKEAAKNNLLEERINGMGIKPEKEKVFKQLFEDLKEWRGKLSNEIRRKYPTYEDYELEEVVQRIIDRLIFIRKMEDLEIEERKLDQVARKINDGDGYVTYRQLKKVFEYYMEKYNSGLFGEEGKEQACDTIDIQDNVIKAVIQGMYTPTGRRVEYNFAAISGDVLGTIYEEYLSYILKVKENQKKTKLEGGRVHKKEQGIYYTPTYIVDYIIKNSAGEYIKNKSIDEILDTKILDPACGSGSFLIRTFSEVCKTIEAKMKKGEISKKSPSLNNYSGRLTLPQKTTILLACIYGVDLDKKAVEIAQLNLFLKLMEGETAETISKLKNTKKILPALNKNILVGNSLIDDESVAPNKAFKWDERFSEIKRYDERGNLKDGCGFDVVIGNPPYDVIYSNEKTKEYAFYKSEKRYVSAEYNPNLFILFIDKSIDLLNENSLLSFIIPTSFLTNRYFKNIREKILKTCQIIQIYDLKKKVFKDANIDTVIIVLRKETDSKKRGTSSVLIKKGLCWESEIGTFSKDTIKQESFLSNPDFVFDTNIDMSFSIIKKKVECAEIKLGDIAEVYRGMVTRKNDECIFYEKKGENYKKLLMAREISRYNIIYENKYIFFDKSSIGGGCWDKTVYETGEKLLVQLIRNLKLKQRLVVALDTEQYYTLQNLNNIIIHDENYKGEYLLALMNSKLINYWFRNMFVDINIKRIYLKQIPIKKISITEQQSIIKLVNKMLSLNKHLSDLGDKKTDERAHIEEEIKKTDKEIDELVYGIYGITKEEKRVIEGNLT